MEIELKFNIPSGTVAAQIWDNELFRKSEEEGSREELYMDAKYFDTENCDLAKNDIAYRVRKEGDRHVAALKWKGHSEDGLHVREEINVPVDSDFPNPSVFRESNVGSQVMELIEGKELHCFLETTVNRKMFRIDTGTGIFEISIDSGEIATKYGTSPIEEVEVELFAGETEELVSIGNMLQEKYNLTPENESKYARGIRMRRETRSTGSCDAGLFFMPDFMAETLEKQRQRRYNYLHYVLKTEEEIY
ncbi:MAG: CYTH domain-containing protein [Bacillota bacterium]|nr:CYTH domain-containing protein [Bacillota bacterium]